MKKRRSEEKRGGGRSKRRGGGRDSWLSSHGKDSERRINGHKKTLNIEITGQKAKVT